MRVCFTSVQAELKVKGEGAAKDLKEAKAECKKLEAARKAQDKQSAAAKVLAEAAAAQAVELKVGKRNSKTNLPIYQPNK